MRPLELTIQGFKSYRDRCSFNFEGRGLFGIVGPTGAGKSSILDALIYCLYGKTPRLERETKKLINSQADEAKLQLAFEMDGVAWRVTRVVRRKGQSQVLLERIDEAVEPVTGDRNVNDKVPQILGLDFGAFCASVCLSQGEFDRFLKATASERVQILKGVFALDKVDALREAAKRHSRLLNDEVRVVQGMLEALPVHIEDRIEESRQKLGEARERVDEIREALPAVTAALLEADRSGREEQLIVQQRREVEKARDSVPPDAVIEGIVDRRETAYRFAGEAEAALAAAEAAVLETESEIAAVDRAGRGWEWCSQVEAAVAARARLRQEQGAQAELITRSKAELARARSLLTQIEGRYEAAQQGLVRAKDELAEIEQCHAAHLLRADLKQGESCPVCEQPVATVPGTPELPAIEGSRAKYERAEESLSNARGALEGSRRDYALAEERRRSAKQSAEKVAGRLRENESLLLSLAGRDKDPVAELAEARRALESLKTRTQAAASARQNASLLMKQALARRNQIESEVLKMVTVLSSVCGQLGVDSALIEEEGLTQTVKRLNELASLRLGELDRRLTDLLASVHDARSTIAAFRSRFGAEGDKAPGEVLGEAISSVQRFERLIDELSAALGRRHQAENQIAELSRRKALYDRLGTDLTDGRFTAYLLSEQTRLLCELASEKFHELTGYYTFDFDAQGNITVVDERTGAIRSPQDTLSGGESFLASLSLALALAETVANRGGRLECFFLDEGFGSLDAEALDRALEGIQRLAEPGRMIGLISHVGGIQSQLEDLIVLERNNDGSTSVVQEAGPIAYLPAAI